MDYLHVAEGKWAGVSTEARADRSRGSGFFSVACSDGKRRLRGATREEGEGECQTNVKCTTASSH